LEKNKILVPKVIEIITCSLCKINTFEKISTKKYCDDCAKKQKKIDQLNFRNKKEVEILTCVSCKINTFEKYKMKKYCDECSILRRRDRSNKYKQNNRENMNEYNKLYKTEHKEELKENRKIYEIENRKQIQDRRTEYSRKRRKSDPAYKLILVARNRMYKLVKGNNNNVSKTIGCDSQFLQNWLSFQFNASMSLDNHGDYWHIDHVIPCAKFNILNKRCQQECFHWSNIQPKERRENLSKNDSLNFREIHLHEIKLYVFIKKYNVPKDLLYSDINRYNSYHKCCS
jgi:hypothetical protein